MPARYDGPPSFSPAKSSTDTVTHTAAPAQRPALRPLARVTASTATAMTTGSNRADAYLAASASARAAPEPTMSAIRDPARHRAERTPSHAASASSIRAIAS
jgi:hypothetical protein